MGELIKAGAGDGWRLCGLGDMDIVKTLECGQCFRWNRDGDGVYRGIALGCPAELWTGVDGIYIRSPGSGDLWRSYFDLERDYAAAAAGFQGGEYLERCVEYGRGIRILRQEPWETLCSFIISQCNNISRIKGIVERLCRSFGEPVEYLGRTYYSFPDSARLAALELEDLDILRCGYRAPYILAAARAVEDGSLDMQALTQCDSGEAKRRLTAMKGIGDKVANCVVLFGLHHMEAFPIDVWIRRALRENFPPDFRPETLGDCAGLAQQYIFFYARSTGAAEKSG